MAIAVRGLGSHIIKHFVCTNTTTTFFFSSLPQFHHLTSSPSVSSKNPKSSSAAALRFFSRSINPLAAKSSTSEEISNAVSSSAYLSVNIRCSRDVADMLSEALLCFGASSAGTDDPDSFRNDDDEVCITSIFPVNEDVHKSIPFAANSIGLKETPSYDVKIGYESDWIEETQQSFQPVQVTDGLWIVPEWKTPPVLQATNIILNPGLAFGTGDHPTTKLCLLLLHRLIKGGESFMDYGTGSGVLAIAALKLGAASSVGLDIDPLAIASARHNTILNNIEPEMLQLHLVGNESNPSLLKEPVAEYDVVIANILMNPLLELADEIVSFCKPGAVVGLSGILSDQLPRIMERYSPLLEDITVSEIDDWVCISGTKKTDLGDS